MNNTDLADQQPHDITEALACMRATLVYYHASHDKRAVFLRLYYIMSLEVHAAIYQLGEYEGRRVFLDPDWVKSLSGKFASRYFTSLTTFERPGCEKAWKIAHAVADKPGSTVVENALLGINAHINYDLPQAIAEQLDPADLDDYSIMQRRKFDHDQVNNLLVRVLEYIQDVLARDYEPGIAVADALLGRLDERMSDVALKYYRERVWWDALAFAAAKRDSTDGIVLDKLDWESSKVADALLAPKMLWTAERVLNRVVSWRGTGNWSDRRLEGKGGATLEPPSKRRRSTLLGRPNPRRWWKRPALPEVSAK